MSRTSELLFKLIRSEVCQSVEEHEGIEDVDFAELYSFAKAQDLCHIVGYALEKNGLRVEDAELAKGFNKQYMLAIYRYQQLVYEYKRICTSLEKNKIKYLPLKGSVIRSYYPVAWMRTSCDIDILVCEEELDRAVEVLVSELKYTTDGLRNYHDISLFAPSGVHLELHFNILESSAAMDAVLSRVWDYTYSDETGEYGFRQTAEFLVFHQIAHAAYHFQNGGCGIRPMLDLWLLREHIKIDGDILGALLTEAELLQFADAVFGLADVWFSGKEHTELTQEMENYIFGAGIYGSLENRVAVARTKSSSKKGYILSRIFMPYRQMKKKYPVLERCPLLLPFCHIARWFGLLAPKKRKNAMQELKYNSEISDDKASRVADLCSELNLKI